MNHNTIKLTLTFFIVSFSFISGFTPVADAIPFCHATGNGGFNLLDTSDPGFGNGHSGHSGDLFGDDCIIEFCGEGYHIVNGACVEIVCPDGQQLNVNTCEDIICPDGQQLNVNTCEDIICPDGQQLNVNTCEDIICPDGQQLNVNTCEDIICPDGQQLNVNTCEDIICPDGQQLNVNTCEDIICPDGQQLNVNTCEDIICPDGQQLNVNTCEDIICPDGQQLNVNTCEDIICPDGQQLNVNTCEDIICPDGQQLNVNTCEDIICPDGQQLNVNTCEDIICPDGQQLNVNTCEDIICPDGQQLNVNTCEDIICPDGQQLNVNTCEDIICPDGQQLNVNTCEDIICPDGQQLNVNTCEDIICPDGQQLNVNTCEDIICPDGQQLNVNTCEDIICPDGQQLNVNTCEDIICPDGQQLNVNTCEDIICPDGQQLNVNTCEDIICPEGEVLIENQCNALGISKTGGDEQWDTRPTFGISHETRETMVVESGFTFNGNSFTLTDNHHTPFDEQVINIGTLNTFAAKVYADKDLKIQEFLFGVPEVGMGHLAEMRVEVWYDTDGKIDDVKVIQDTEVIDRSSLSITHKKSKCLATDTEENCDSTTLSAVFLEPLADKVMAIKAIDFALRGQTTYLNEGFDTFGESLNPMATKMIPSSVKGEGLIQVTQNEKYSDYWTTEDGRIFKMSSFGSFKQINPSFVRFQDSGEPLTRLHSEFGKMVEYEKQRATQIFDATQLLAESQDSFGHEIVITERMNEAMKQKLLVQEELAKELFDKWYNIKTNQ